MKLRNALLAATVLAAPVVAHAQVIDGFYVGAGAGGNLLQTETVKNYNYGGTGLGSHSNLRFDAGPVVVASAGYGLGNGLRFELEGGFRQNKLNKYKAAATTSSAGGEEQKESVFLNALYDLDFGAPVVPYVGGGVGYVHDKFNNLHIRTTTGNTFIRSTGQSDDLGYQAIVGVSFPIYQAVPGLAFTAEYRFMGQTDYRSDKTQYFHQGTVSGPKLKLEPDDFNHSILLGVRYAFNVPGPAAPVVVPPPAQQTVARTYLVFFDWDRADLTERARQIIAEAAAASTRTQTTRIDVQGNADKSGTAAYNQRLSLRRAQVVAAELVRRGVPKQEINIQAFGDTRPLVPTAAGVREPQNRRVEIILH